MSKENQEDYSWLTYLPDNYVNSGSFLGGLFSAETAQELVIIGFGIYALTRVFLEPVVSGNIVWAVRIALAFLVLSLNFLIRTAFNSSIIGFLTSLYEYFKLTKKYRYERRDPAYVRRKEEENARS